MRRPKLRKWTEAQQEFMRFLCLPDLGRNREIQTYDEFARSVGVSRQTLFNWEHTPGFYEALQAMSRRVILEQEPEFLKEISTVMRNAHSKGFDRVSMVYWRYVRPALLAELDLTDSYLELKADNTSLLAERNQRIWERIMELPADTRDVVFDIMREATTEPDDSQEVLDPEGTYRTRALAAPLTRDDEPLDVEGTMKTGAVVPPAKLRSPAGRPRMSQADKHKIRPIRPQ